MQLRIFTEPQEGATYDQLRRVAAATEDLGFDAFFRSDHYLAMDTDGLPGPTDAWVTLAGLARETTRIRLGTLVSPVTFRLPGPLAISVAQIDAMSGGRVELGIGAGWYEVEHTAYGIPFPRLGDRFDLLEEQLAVITGLWESPPGQRYSFTGDRYTLTDSPALPKPVQRPRPPLILGGKGRTRTPRLAARFADEFNVGFSSRRGRARRRPACDGDRTRRRRPATDRSRGHAGPDRRPDRAVRRARRLPCVPAGARSRRPRPPGTALRPGAEPGRLTCSSAVLVSSAGAE